MQPCTVNTISGWLEKQSRYLKAWRNRWVVFNGFELLTFIKQQNISGYHANSNQIYYSQTAHLKAT